MSTRLPGSVAALQPSEERLRVAMEAAAIIWWEFDPSAMSWSVSPNFAAPLGMPGDLAADPAATMALMVREDAAALREGVERTARGEGDLFCECRFVHPSSREFLWVEVVGRLLPAGPQMGPRVVGVARNITERKQAEEEIRTALQRAELEHRRLAAVLDAMPAGVAIADATGKVTHFNAALAKLWGHPPAPESTEEYREWRARWAATGEALTADDWAMARALRTGEVVEGDFLEIEAFDGRRRAIINTAAPIKDAGGRVIGGVVAEVDITGQREAERLLAESEQLYRAVVENTTAIILRVDPQGIVRFANQRALDFFGYTREELLGRHAVGTIVPERESSGRDLAAMVEELAADPDRFHANANENVRKSGERVWLEWTNAGIYDANGRLKEFLSVGIDATERRRAEEDVKVQRALFETVVTNLPVAVSIVRASDLRCLLVNREYHALAPHKEMVGSTLQEIWPEAPELEGIFREVARTGRPYSVVDAPYRIQRSEGGPLQPSFFSWSLYRIPVPGGGWGLLNTAWETTERKKAEEALNAANARLREADRRKDEFLAMLGHELRNPLAVIAGALQVMGVMDPGDASFRRALAAAGRQSAHMARLVDELLDVSRITEGKVTLKREELNLADVIESAVEGARTIIEGQGHRLFLSIAREHLGVAGDPVRLAQAVGNILNNAAKYTAPGGEIRVVLERRGASAIVSVSDTGIGISPDLLPRVFDLFVQGERGEDRAQGGLGIGLTLARRLVEMHGGRIEALSAGSGHGSQFTITLPLLADSPAQAAMGTAAALATARRRILVVDDNPDGAEMLTLQLQLEGHEVITEFNGPAALTAAAAHHPDAVILDIGMPGMDGYEVARRMRADPALAGTRLIALTGYGQDEDVEASREAGFDNHLVKPVDVDALRRLLS